MNPLIALHPEATAIHHAYLLAGSFGIVLADIQSFAEDQLGLSWNQNPDIIVLEHDTFGVGESRRLQAWVTHRPLATRKLMVVGFRSMTLEAQNALLKTLEEPRGQTHFFFITDDPDTLLDTLRSRCLQLTHHAWRTTRTDLDIEAFIHATPAERLQQVKKIADSKDRQHAQHFLQTLRAVLAKERPTPYTVLTEIEAAQDLLQQRGSSIKMVLDHVALTL